LIALAVLGSPACGLNVAGTGPVADGADATASSDAAGTADTGTTKADGALGCITCAGACVPDCNACASGKYDCHGVCVSGCDQCGGDFVVCLVCAGGGAMVRECSSSQPGGCLDGNYDHCPCSGDKDCPEGNQRCTSDSHGVCTACGEAQFSHNSCNQGCCCKSGSSTGRCTCSSCD
jgi:hypothetical protein